MRQAGHDRHGRRLSALIVVLWRASLRINEALALNETDLDRDRGSLLVRRGKGDKRREVGMDRWAWAQLEPWLELRTELLVGRLFWLTAAPPSPVVEPCCDGRLLSAAALRLGKPEVAATIAVGSPDGAPAAVPIATASRSWLWLTSASSGGSSQTRSPPPMPKPEPAPVPVAR